MQQLNYSKSNKGGCSLELLFLCLACEGCIGRMGFLPLPFPKPEAMGGGANFNGASCRFGDELKKSPKSVESSCGFGMVQSLALSIEFELPLEVLRLLRLCEFEDMDPLFQLD